VERNSLFLFKPTASFCFGEKVLSSGTRIPCPSMSDGGRGCFYTWVVGMSICGTQELSQSGKGRSGLHSAAACGGREVISRAG